MRGLTVASYNIHRCIGTDGRHDPDRVAAVIGELHADVVGLQEVDSRYHVAHGVDQIEYLAHRTGLAGVPGPVVRGRGGQYGNGLLTRHRVVSVRRIDLSIPGRERRGALDVHLEARGRRLRVIVTHLGLNPAERRMQVSRLLTVIANGRPGPIILAGDLNEWFPPGRPLRQLHRHFGRTLGPRSFPSRFPILALDRIWVQPRAALVRVEAHTSARARLASDHLPVRALLSGF